MSYTAIKGGNATGAGTRPFLYDPLLSNGSLMLIDVRNWAAGVPTNNTLLPNVARIQAKALLSATDDEVAGVFKQVGDLVGGGMGGIERTGKGGLHTWVRQSSPITQLQGFGIELPDKVMAHMVNNPSHNYFYALPRLLTRVAIPSANAVKTFMDIEQGANEGGFVRLSENQSQELPFVGQSVGRTVEGAGINALGVTMQAIGGRYSAVNVTIPTLPNYASGLARYMATWGSVRRQNTDVGGLARLQSWAFYWAYIEDLTVSGRSYNQVYQLAQARYNGTFGAGKVFANDTFTPPG